MNKEWVLTAAGVIFLGLLAWGGNTLNGLQTKVATLEATQVQLIKTIDRTLDELSK